MSENTFSNQEFQIPPFKKDEAINVAASEQTQTTPEVKNKIISIEGLRRSAEESIYIAAGTKNIEKKIPTEVTFTYFIGDDIALARRKALEQAA